MLLALTYTDQNTTQIVKSGLGGWVEGAVKSVCFYTLLDHILGASFYFRDNKKEVEHDPENY